MKRIAYIFFACLFYSVSSLIDAEGLWAQTPIEEKKFVIYDATTKTPPNDGEQRLGFNKMDSVTVFVTWKASADSVVSYYRGINDAGNRYMFESFINFYTEKRYILTPNAKGEYNLAEANSIAEELYRDFKPMIDYWIEEDRRRGRSGSDMYSVALLLYREGKPIEKHDLDPILNYGGDDYLCPIYFHGANITANTDVIKKMRTGKLTKLVIVKGDELPITENLHIAGPEDYRMVVDRYIETCTFEEDYDRVSALFKGNSEAQSKVKSLLLHESVGDSVYRQPPYVFAGEEFQKALYRRSGWDLSRDTMEYYRKETQRAFAQSRSGNKYQIVNPDSISFNIENNLWYEVCQYPDFQPIKEELCRVSPALPKDGGRHDDSDDVKVYEMRTDTALYQRLNRYVERGYRIATDSAAVRTSADIIVQGWVSRVNRINEHLSESVEFVVLPDYVQLLTNDSSDFKNMQRESKAMVLRTEADKSMRVRVKDANAASRFRELFQKVLEDDDPIYLSPQVIDTVSYWSWRMPDRHKFYTMKHVYYLHDFIHADTTSSLVCPCARLDPLRFLSPSHGAAMHDCPPSDNYEAYRPISSSKDPKTVDKYAYLQFDLSSSVIRVEKDSNRAQLNILKQAAYDIKHEEGTNNRIDSIKIVGISSPEGGRARNENLSRQRASSLGSWVRNNCEGTQYTRMIPVDSVASWYDVADMLIEMDTTNRPLAEEILQKIVGIDPHDTDAQNKAVAYKRNVNPVLDAAVEKLRKVQVRFFYQATSDPSEETVVNAYLKGNNPELFDAYYYYVLLNSDQIPHEDKIKLSKYVLNLQKDRVKNFTVKSRQPRGKFWFDLVLPVAANLLAVDSIQAKHWDTELLRPFIDLTDERGNVAAFSEYENRDGSFKQYKFVNLDFILYNQVQMLMGRGDDASLEEANALIQILDKNTPSMSSKFMDKYQPKVLKDFLDCHLKSFTEDPDLAERMKKTHLINAFVVNMAIAHEIFATENSYANQKVKNAFLECYGKLEELNTQYPDRVETYYFTAVTEARYADAKGFMTFEDIESSGFSQKAHFDNAKKALVELFKKDEDYISRCQGDRYIRDIYTSPQNKSANVDIYLEAVEAYIKDILNNE